MNTLTIFARQNNKKFCGHDLISARKTSSETRKLSFPTATLKIKIPYKTASCEKLIAWVNINTADAKDYKSAYRKTNFLIQTRTIPDKSGENIKECFSRRDN
ncbi:MULTISPECIES: hypothetical protein [Pantoea]|uniref:Uncharacterized protein n=1 Tax=Candidatus Pantoea gossypiicola TaxID=2608008 RepID=A0AB34CEK1_9GAMM|nr:MULTISPECIES: hypothetical protein [Pantoea]KAA5923692.1 hypothetical protein F3I59_20185 [Pantoea sp. VH_8]KAA5929423.1 hypothetical protein F3I58_20965 [Pantoea sp. VH_4]KAA5981251.1 hypothetical protein F3I49_20165 [Pantoea sp. M_4]KAA6119934.1 hypothetical protein F3I20_20795 [Pantoea gossypiicola]